MSRSVSRRSGSARGSASLEIAILGPALLLLIFATVQGALWFYARSLALEAAQEGAAAGRARGASASVAVNRANAFLQRSAQDSLQGTTVSSAGSSATTIRIEVKGRSLSVLPGFPGIDVSQSAEAPVERFTTGTG